MRSILAIVAGSVFIVVAMLCLELAYVFIAVGYNALAADFPVLHDITGVFRYLVGIPVFMVTMFAGGYVTASIANMNANIKILFHCLAVGLITVGGMMYFAMDNSYSTVTLTGIVVTLLALSASSAGGFYWLRGNTNKSATLN